MAVVVIMCPPTGKQVSTGIRMDRITFDALPGGRQYRSHCWHCGREHSWSKRWAILVDERDPAFAEATPRAQ